MSELSWMKDCVVCNAGVCTRMRELLDADDKLTVNKAAKIMAEEAVGSDGVKLISANAIRCRYRLHTGEREPNKKVGHNEQLSEGLSDEEFSKIEDKVGHMDFSQDTGSTSDNTTFDEAAFDRETERIHKEFERNNREWDEFTENFNNLLSNMQQPFPPELKDMLRKLVKVGYRELAKKYHPDVNGSNSEMSKLNNVKDLLLHMVE